MDNANRGSQTLIAKAVLVVGLVISGGLLGPSSAKATEMERCVWYNDGSKATCHKGCEAWIFTTCSTNGSQGCYDASGICGDET